MSCYRFIFHGHRTWMPDEDDGYVKRGEGRLPWDVVAAARYRTLRADQEVEFHEVHQLVGRKTASSAGTRVGTR